MIMPVENPTQNISNWAFSMPRIFLRPKEIEMILPPSEKEFFSVFFGPGMAWQNSSGCFDGAALLQMI